MTNLEYYKERIIEEFEKSKYDAPSRALGLALINICPLEEGSITYLLDWFCEEHKEPILDDVEREYLSNVIMPFRKYEIKITKEKGIDDFEYLKFYIYKINDWGSTIYFPPFSQNTMYKGMELDKEYTLKELGL